MQNIEDISPNPRKKILAAFMPYSKHQLIGNAFLINDNCRDWFTSMLIKKFHVEAHTFLSGLEETITSDILGRKSDELQNLDEKGIVKQGTLIKKRDILVGKVRPKTRAELTSEEKMLTYIFGRAGTVEYVAPVEMPFEDQGKVVDVEYKEEGGKIKSVDIYVLFKKPLESGDVFKNTKGNKGNFVGFFNPYLLSKSRGDYELKIAQIGVLCSPNSDFISGLDEIAERNVFYDRKNNQLKLFRGKRSKHAFLGKAKIGYITLERISCLTEDKITVLSSGGYNIMSQQPLTIDDSGYQKCARISKAEISALRNFPNLIKEAIRTRGDDAKSRLNAYKGLVKNGKF